MPARLTSVLALALVFSAREARADERATCLAAAEEGQSFLRSHHLLDARRRLAVCARPECPGQLQRDCSAWLAEADVNLPSIVVAVVDAEGHDVLSPVITLDGTPTTAAAGVAFEVDPGTHVVQVEGAGRERFVAREGEKARRILLRLPAASRPAERTRSRAPVFVASGIALTALGLFAGFGAAGLSVRGDDCNGGSCGQHAYDRVHRDFLVADVALGVSLVAAAVTGWLWYAGRRHH